MSFRSPYAIILLLSFFAGQLAPSPASASSIDSVSGRWLTDDHSALIEINPCGDKLCGRIAKVLDPKAPENDINNPDRRQRADPLVGKRILWNFVRAGSGWKNGRAYDPKSGETYRSKLRILGNGRLEVTGCILFLCRSRYWKRSQ